MWTQGRGLGSGTDLCCENQLEAFGSQRTKAYMSVHLVDVLNICENSAQNFWFLEDKAFI